MTLNPMTAEELNGQIDSTGQDDQAEFSTEIILENFILYIVSHFCVGTEMRFIAMQMSSSSNSSTFVESEQWHARAVQVAHTFMPKACPLVQHIISTFLKQYN